MVEIFDVNMVEQFIKEQMKDGRGPAWAKNLLIFLLKFGNFMAEKEMVSSSRLKKFRAEIQGLKRTFGRTIAKNRVIR